MADSDLDYATVTGRFGLHVPDTDDTGDNPDTIYCNQGTVEFTPLVTFEKVNGTPWPYEAGESVFVAQISGDDYIDPTVVGDDRNGARDGAGHLTWRDKPFIKLLDLTSSKVNPRITDISKATHSVAFKNVKAVVDGVTISVNFPPRPGRFTVDGPDGDGVNDLYRVLPISTGSATPITIGPRGISVIDASITEDGELVLNLSDASEVNAGALPGTAEAMQAATTAVGAADAADTAKADAENARTEAQDARDDLLGQKGAPSGIAPLDIDQKIPDSNLPDRLSDSSITTAIAETATPIATAKSIAFSVALGGI